MNPFIGELKIFGGNFAPVGWLFCAGQLLPISEYSILFNLIGTTYGGDGIQTFALPDLRGRVPIHQSSSHALGAVGGSETVALTSAQMPSHTHGVSASSSAAIANAPGGNLLGATTGALNVLYGPPTNTTSLQPQAVSAVGTGAAHDNIMPSLVVNWIIAYEGIYPSQG